MCSTSTGTRRCSNTASPSTCSAARARAGQDTFTRSPHGAQKGAYSQVDRWVSVANRAEVALEAADVEGVEADVKEAGEP